MLTIKTFKDGDRLVVVFEGLNDIPSVETLVNTYISGIGATHIKGADTFAAPVKQSEESTPVLPPAVFQDGPYAGMYPAEIMNTPDINEQNRAFQYFCKELASINDNELRDAMLHAATAYMKKRFENTNPTEYAEKLNDKQVTLFYISYDTVISQELKASLCNKYACQNWTAFAFSEISVLRSGIMDILASFKTQ